MKTFTSKILLALSPLALCGGCNFMQVSSPTVGFANPNRVSVVEKAWMARHEYDAKTGLLHPYYRGMRYGATRSYDQSEKTLSSKEWWMKDRKLTELKDQPLQFATRKPLVPVALPAAGASTQPTLVTNPPVRPTSVAGSGPSATALPGAGSDMPLFSTGGAVPDLPGGIPADAIGIDSPFLPPVPSATGAPAAGSGTIPGMPLPGTPLMPGGAVDPGLGNLPFGGNPPAAGGAFPAPPPVAGGAMPAPPPAPAPVDNNPFGAPPPPGANPNPAVPAPAPVDGNPFPAPAVPGANPNLPAPAPAPVDENPFPAPPPAPVPGVVNPAPPAPVPGGENPFPAPGGDDPGKPPPLPF